MDNQQGISTADKGADIEKDLANQAAAVLDRMMKMRGLSAPALGRIVGVSKGTIRNKRNGKTMLNFSELWDYARALDVEPQVFLMTPEQAMLHVARAEYDATIPEQSQGERANNPNELVQVEGSDDRTLVLA